MGMFSISCKMTPVEVFGRNSDDSSSNRLTVCGIQPLMEVGYSLNEAVSIVWDLENRRALDKFVIEHQYYPTRKEVESLITIN